MKKIYFIALLFLCASCSFFQSRTLLNLHHLENQSYCFNMEFLEEKNLTLSFGEIPEGGHQIPIDITPSLENPSPKPLGAHFQGRSKNSSRIEFEDATLHFRNEGNVYEEVLISGELHFIDNDHFISEINTQFQDEETNEVFYGPKLLSYGQKGACPAVNFQGNHYPKLARNTIIHPSKIHRISKFRSAAGHSATDNAESCRSMRHYFETNLKTPEEARQEKVFAPFDGRIIYIFDSLEENRGQDVVIQSSENTAFKLRLNHVILSSHLKPGDLVHAGQSIGHIYARDLMEGQPPEDFQATIDVILWVQRSIGTRLISFFNILSEQPLHNIEKAGYPATWKESLHLEKNDPQVLSYRCGENGDPSAFLQESVPKDEFNFYNYE